MKNNNNFNKNINFILIFIFLLIIILFIIFYNKINIKEHFSDTNITSNTNSVGLKFETGTSGISSTGTISFKSPFSKPPVIFTQINANTTNSKNIFSVNVFDITANGFNYSKNQAYNSTGVAEEYSFSVPKIDPSTLETFNWIAIS